MFPVAIDVGNDTSGWWRRNEVPLQNLFGINIFQFSTKIINSIDIQIQYE
jgi:hypothetical protein